MFFSYFVKKFTVSLEKSSRFMLYCIRKSKEGSAALINRKKQWQIFLAVNGGLLLLLLLFPLYEAIRPFFLGLTWQLQTVRLRAHQEPQA
jgi:hypothetical protein